MRRRTACAAAWIALLLAGTARADLRERIEDLGERLPSGLHFYGFAELRGGVWTQSHPTQPLLFPGITEEPTDDDAAVFRSTLQLEADWIFDPRTELHAVVRLAYEPRYPVDKYASNGSRFGAWQLDRSEYNDPDSSREILREIWLRRDLAPGHSFRVGRQIVNWGESLAFRVADVINPNDSRTSLFFLDAQDSRIPQWMLQVLHEFPELPGAPALEWILVPPFDPEERRVDDFAPTGSRFAPPSETRLSRFPFFEAAGLTGLWTVQRAFANGGAVDFRFLDEDRKDFPDGWRVGARIRFTLGPVELALFDWYGYDLTPVVEDLGLTPFVITDYNGVLNRPDLADVYTSLGIPPPVQAVLPLNAFRFEYKRQNVLGMTGNAYVAPLRAVARFELAWRADQHFQMDGFDRNTGAITDQDGIRRSDLLQWQLAVDFGGIYWPRLNREGSFTFNFEYTQNIVLSHDREMRVAVYETRLHQVSDTFSFRASTEYAYNTIQPSVIWIRQTQQNAWALVLSLGLTAPWNERLTGELRYVSLGGHTNFNGLGLFRRKDFAMASIRYSF